jgi:hypothetical protein
MRVGVLQHAHIMRTRLHLDDAILEARNPYHRVIFVHLPLLFLFACGGQKEALMFGSMPCASSTFRSPTFDLTDSKIDRPCFLNARR